MILNVLTCVTWKVHIECVMTDQESGVRSQESGVRSQESGVRSQESPCHMSHGSCYVMLIDEEARTHSFSVSGCFFNM